MADYNDDDVAFIQAMIPHHKAALDMAAVEYGGGQNKEVTEWALEIFLGQREEIAKFRAWLQERGIPEQDAEGEQVLESMEM